MLTTGENYYLYNSSFIAVLNTWNCPLPISITLEKYSWNDCLGIYSVEMQLLWASSSMSRATEVRYRRFWCFTGNGLVKTRLLRYWTIMSHPISVNQWKGRPTFPPLCLLDDVLQTFTRAHLTLEAWKKSVVPWIIVVEMSFPAPLSTYSPYNYWVCVFSKGRGGGFLG